jgi:hypothetical protein
MESRVMIRRNKKEQVLYSAHQHGFPVVDFFSVQAMPWAYRSPAHKAVDPPLLSIHIGATRPVIVKENLKKQKTLVDECSQTSDCSAEP